MNALSSNYFICYKSWPLKRHLKEKFMFGFHYAFCVSVLFGMLKTLWEPRLVMAWFLVTHNMMKVIVSIFRTAYSTFSFLCLWPFQIYTASPTASTCSSTALFCYWMTYLIILTLLINPDSFLSSSLKELLLALLLHLTAYTFHMHSQTCMYIFGCMKLTSFFDPFEAYLCTKTIWNLCGNAWLAFDSISPMTVEVNYHMIFLPPSLDGVNFLLKDFLSFKK